MSRRSRLARRRRRPEMAIGSPGASRFFPNPGLPDHATVIASTDPSAGASGLTAFWVPLATPGVTIKPMVAIAPHPIGALELRGVMLPASARIGAGGEGRKPR